MKRIKTLILALMLPTLSLISCDKKDKNLPEPQPQPPVVTAEKYEGTWNGLSMHVEAFFMSQSLYTHTEDLEEGELVLKINNNNTLEITGSNEGGPAEIIPYTRVNAYTIKFEVDLDEGDDIVSGNLEYTFQVDESNNSKANMFTEVENIIIEDGMPPMDLKLNVELAK